MSSADSTPVARWTPGSTSTPLPPTAPSAPSASRFVAAAGAGEAERGRARVVARRCHLARLDVRNEARRFRNGAFGYLAARRATELGEGERNLYAQACCRLGDCCPGVGARWRPASARRSRRTTKAMPPPSSSVRRSLRSRSSNAGGACRQEAGRAQPVPRAGPRRDDGRLRRLEALRRRQEPGAGRPARARLAQPPPSTDRRRRGRAGRHPRPQRLAGHRRADPRLRHPPQPEQPARGPRHAVARGGRRRGRPRQRRGRRLDPARRRHRHRHRACTASPRRPRSATVRTAAPAPAAATSTSTPSTRRRRAISRRHRHPDRRRSTRCVVALRRGRRPSSPSTTTPAASTACSRYAVTRRGTYFVAVAGFGDVPDDPFDSGERRRRRQRGPVRPDDHRRRGRRRLLRRRLRKGDVLGASVDGRGDPVAPVRPGRQPR